MISMENKKIPFGLTITQYEALSQEHIDLLIEKHGRIVIFPYTARRPELWGDDNAKWIPNN